jgi:uncharacterized protein
MPSLSDKLRSLGVKVGASEIPPPLPRTTPSRHGLEDTLEGRVISTPLGDTFLVEKRYPMGHPYGQMHVQISSRLEALGQWAGDARIASLPPQSFAFIDTETTGLSGGAGTYAFLIGVGRFAGDEFVLSQFFMRDPVEEPAQLAALEAFLAPCTALVSFNGKAFDLPLLHTRFTSHGLVAPFSNSAHVDLLHIARRLWRNRLSNRALINLEVQILGTSRTEEDVPGWMIPSLYFQYLRSGDASPLKRVIYHNALDVVSMVALFDHVAALLSDPFAANLAHAEDAIALARLYEDLGQIERAEQLYRWGLERELPQQIRWDGLQRLALLYKRQGSYLAALPLWEKAAQEGVIEAWVELAKYYEHQARQVQQALECTLAAIHCIQDPACPPYQRAAWLSELQHRLERLQRKEP